MTPFDSAYLWVWALFVLGGAIAGVCLRVLLSRDSDALPRAGAIALIVGCAVAGLVSLAISVSTSDVIAGLASFVAGSAGAFLFIAGLFLSRTSIRITALRRLAVGDPEATRQSSSTDRVDEDLEERLHRLESSGYVIIVDGRALATRSPALLYATLVVALRRLFFGTSY